MKYLTAMIAVMFVCAAVPRASAQRLSAQRKLVVELYNSVAALGAAGKRAEALERALQMLAIAERTYSPNDPQFSEVLYLVGEAYEGQSRYEEAVSIFKRDLTIREKVYGPSHPKVGQLLVAIGLAYESEGRFADAEPALKQAIAIAEKSGNPDYIGIALNDLAGLYNDQARYADAIPLAERALLNMRRARKPDDTELATELDNLALYYAAVGRDKDAEPLFKEALTIRENALRIDGGSNAAKFNLSIAQGSLATLYRDQGRFADSEALYRQALALQKEVHESPAESLLQDMAALYRKQQRYSEAEGLYKQAYAIAKKTYGSGDPYLARTLNDLASLYNKQGRFADALPLVQESIAGKSADSAAALPALFGAQAQKLIAGGDALEAGLNVVQHASQNAAGQALNALAVRFAAGGGRLAQLVRQDQDLAAEAASLDKAIVTAVSKDPAQRDAATEQKVRDRIAAIAKQRDDLSRVFAREFPDYAALSRPEPLKIKDIQPLLADDEALVVIALGDKSSYVWAITHNGAEWKQLSVGADDISKQVAALRGRLNFYSIRPFDANASFTLYQKVLAPVEDLIAGKPRLSFVLNSALTSLPPQLLVTRDPTGKGLKDVDWLIRSHAVTVLPSVESLKVLRGKSAITDAPKPLIGFADPVFDGDREELAQNTAVAADVAAARGIRGTVANLAELRVALPPLPETAGELREVASSVHADPADIILGADATVSRVKQEKLDQFRIVYFATHGLLAGDVAEFVKLDAEPALVLSLPTHPTEADNGLLTASEVAQLKLNADWVVLSACNTAAAEKPGAEALSGLARAFFYAGARSLVVSNWGVDSKSAVALMAGTFAALAADPKLSHAQALQKSMLAMIGDPQHPERADPKYWAPFIVVGEPAMLAK